MTTIASATAIFSRGISRQTAIVGLNRETANILPRLLEAEGLRIVKVLNPDLEDLERLAEYPDLALIIDTTHSASVASRLRRLVSKKTDVISGLGARILFCTPTGGAQTGRNQGVLNSLEEIRQAVSLAKNKDEVLKVILNTALRALEADGGSIMLLDPSRKFLTVAAQEGLDDSVAADVRQKVGRGVAGRAVEGREPIRILGRADAAMHGAERVRDELVSSIVCPLAEGNEIVGVLNVNSRRSFHSFTEDDADFTADFARLTAELIFVAKDYEANLASAFTLGLLNAAREILSLKYPFAERLNLLLMKVAHSFGAKVCTYYEYRREYGAFLATASSSVKLNLSRGPSADGRRLDDFFAEKLLSAEGGPGTTCFTSGTGPARKWYVANAVRSGRGLAGALFLHLQSEKESLEEEISLLRKIADLLGREVAKNRELEAMRVQSMRYSAISQFSFDVAQAGNLSELTHMLLGHLRLILEAETCVLRLKGGPSEPLFMADCLSPRRPSDLKDLLDLDAKIAAELGPGNNSLLFADLSRARFAGKTRAKSVLAMAIAAEGEMLGTISLYDRQPLDMTEETDFGEGDKEVLLNFCLQAGKALRRFRPFTADPS